MSNLKEKEDFYYTENGLLVFTSSYHLKRGKCCASACRHCPYHYENVPEPRRTEFLEKRPPVILMHAPKEK